MAYDPQLADLARAYVKRRRGFEEKKMFGGIGWMFHGNMCYGVHGEHLIFRVGKETADDAIAAGKADPMNLTGKVMKGWVWMTRDKLRTQKQIEDWAARAHAFAKTLPKKAGAVLAALALLGAAAPVTAQTVPASAPAALEAERTVPVENGPFEGFNLFCPLRSNTTYLVDMEGRVMHEWPSEHRGHSVYLMDDGSLMRTTQDQGVETFEGGGQAGRIQRIAWDGSLIWDYSFNSAEKLSHHDVEPMPNGNVLFIAWDLVSREEALANGRDPELLEWDAIWPDAVYEVRPLPPTGGEIVWEWHVWDHLVQDFDSSKKNFGVVADHPERVNVNGDRPPPEDQPTDEEIEEELAELEALGYAGDDEEEEELEPTEEEEARDRARRRSTADWMHSNAVDYHAELDLIAISVRRFHEIWVIDHSTTTEEARGSTGGNHGKGGDLLYRWGNPYAYGRGRWEDRVLFGQHDIQWIPEGLPGAGNLLLFNNGSDRSGRAWSTLDEWAIPTTASGRIPVPADEPFGPRELAWQFTPEDKEDFFSSFISGVQRLPNGNTLACVGRHGRFIEVTPTGEEVWRWENDLGDEEVDPDDPPTVQWVNRTAVFRVTRVAPDHPGLARLVAVEDGEGR